jgi:hypothetical protein
MPSAAHPAMLPTVNSCTPPCDCGTVMLEIVRELLMASRTFCEAETAILPLSTRQTRSPTCTRSNPVFSEHTQSTGLGDIISSSRGTTHMPIDTPVTKLLRVRHPILLAPMDLVADGNLTAAVDAAGGFGILGGGYGEEKWLVRQLDSLEQAKARFGVGFITWSMAKQPRLLDLVLERRPVAIMLSFGSPAPFIDRIKRSGALVICQVQSLALAKEAIAAGADILVAQGTEAGGHGGPANQAALNCSAFVAVDSAGNLYVEDNYERIRKVSASTAGRATRSNWTPHVRLMNAACNLILPSER